MRIVIAVLLLAGIGLAETKPTPKKFIPPASSGVDRGLVSGGLLAKDRDCARDSVKLDALSGLELRKYMMELVTLGCVEPITAVYSAVALDTESISAAGKTARFRKVQLMRRNDLTVKQFGEKGLTGEASRTGWARELQFVKDAQ